MHATYHQLCSLGNVLYEIDGQSALELYKRYLGGHAADLPASGLLFPLSVRRDKHENGVVCTILGVNEDQQSITFAGDVPEGMYARLMKANFDRLVDSAVQVAQTSYVTIGSTSPALAILISCVGRKLVLKQRIEEEVDSVSEILGNGTVQAVLTGIRPGVAQTLVGIGADLRGILTYSTLQRGVRAMLR